MKFSLESHFYWWTVPSPWVYIRNAAATQTQDGLMATHSQSVTQGRKVMHVAMDIRVGWSLYSMGWIYWARSMDSAP